MMAPMTQNQIVAGTSHGSTTIDVEKLLDKPWYKYAHLRSLYLWLTVVLVVQATNGFDGSLMNGVQALTYWQAYFDHPTGSQLGIFNGTQGLGGVVSQLFLWWLVEKIGRRYTIIIGAVIIILGVFLQTFATGLAMFASARAVIGFGLSFEYTAAPMLITEVAHPAHRAPLSTLLNTLYYFGATIAAWVTLGTLTIQSDWSWRSVSLLQMFPSLISISLTWFVPESPRWLISRGRSEEAYRLLVKHHCGGDESDPLASFEFHEIQSALTFEKEHGSGSWLDLMRTKGNRYRSWIVATISFASQATGTTLVGYYLVVVLSGVGITNARTQSIINGCLTMWNMGWAFWGASVIDKFGRRKMMLSSLTGMLFCGMLPWTICNAVYTVDGKQGAGYAVIAFIFIFTAFYASTWNGILTGYTVECMSYDVRPKLICAQNLLVQATITGFNYLNPVALANVGWKYYVAICCIILAELVVVFFTYPETSRITLEEVNIIFDGQTAVRNDLTEKSEAHAAAEEVEMTEGSKTV
jgi:sugar porter (SP) family MFS transporter